jgi:hypothetical protein
MGAVRSSPMSLSTASASVTRADASLGTISSPGARRPLPGGLPVRLAGSRGEAGETPLEKLEALGVRGILRQLVRDGQIIDVRCEMPQWYCFRGRRYFEPSSSGSHWSPTADHYPRLKVHGGHLTPDNVRLAHRLCNRRDYTWRMKINAMLGKRMSLEEIADELNAKKVSTIHGTNRWTAPFVGKAFVS